MNDESIFSILQYANTYLFSPMKSWPRLYFEERSYARWAVNEIIKNILDHPFYPADEIVYDFVLTMELFSKQTEGSEICFRFSVAKEIAEDILKIL